MIDLRRVEAVLFDINGTMIDDHHYNYLGWKEFCRRRDMDLPMAVFQEKALGLKNQDILTNLFGPGFSEEEMGVFGAEKELAYREIYADSCCEVPGLTALMRLLIERGIRLGVVSLAVPENREFTFRSLGISEEWFDVIVGEEHVSRGKPHPDMYLRALELLNIKAENCLVFEDSPTGLLASTGAGIPTIGVLTAHSPEELHLAQCHIRDYTEIVRALVAK